MFVNVLAPLVNQPHGDRGCLFPFDLPRPPP